MSFACKVDVCINGGYNAAILDLYVTKYVETIYIPYVPTEIVEEFHQQL